MDASDRLGRITSCHINPQKDVYTLHQETVTFLLLHQGTKGIFSHINFNTFRENETLDSWLMADQSPVRKRKGEEECREREVKKHKELDHKEINKIEEDRHEVNTKTEHGMAHD